MFSCNFPPRNFIANYQQAKCLLNKNQLFEEDKKKGGRPPPLIRII